MNSYHVYYITGDVYECRIFANSIEEVKQKFKDGQYDEPYDCFFQKKDGETIIKIIHNQTDEECE